MILLHTLTLRTLLPLPFKQLLFRPRYALRLRCEAGKVLLGLRWERPNQRLLSLSAILTGAHDISEIETAVLHLRVRITDVIVELARCGIVHWW